MGVIIPNERLLVERAHGQPMWNAEEHLGDYVFTDSDTTSTEESDTNSVPMPVVVQVLNRRRRVKQKGQQLRRGAHGRAVRPAGHQDTNAVLGRHASGTTRLGARKQRRLDNERMLNAICDLDDVCDDLSDMLPPSMSAFAHLFVDDDAMKNWQHFIDASEKEQQRILIAADVKHRRYFVSNIDPSFDILDDPNTPSSSLGARGMQCGSPFAQNGRRHARRQQRRRQRESQTEGDDGEDSDWEMHPLRSSRRHRSGNNPTFSASECYGRIDVKLRSLVTNKHAPWGMLTDYEKELTDFFLTSPDGVYVNVFDEAFDRLVLHCVAQYLALKSKSTTHPSGARETSVENPRPYFVPPRQTLHDYVHKLQGK